MATEQKKFNIYGGPINKNQLSLISDYLLKTFIDNKLKVVERFEDKILIGGDYYLEENENINNLILEYCINRNQRWCFHFNKQIFGIFTLWDWEFIDEKGILSFKGKKVLDNKNRKIFYCQHNLQTNEVKGKPEKIFYQNLNDDENSDILFRFNYHEDGRLFIIEDPNEIYLDKIIGAKPQDFINSSCIQTIFPWDQHSYYHSALPYLPIESLLLP
jgi:hypothetical protein